MPSVRITTSNIINVCFKHMYFQLQVNKNMPVAFLLLFFYLAQSAELSRMNLAVSVRAKFISYLSPSEPQVRGKLSDVIRQVITL